MEKALRGEDMVSGEPAKAPESGSGETGARGGARPGAWRAPLIACGAALAILAVLLIPGVLVYPSAPARSLADDVEAQRLRSSNDSLEAQLKALEAGARSRDCRPADEALPVPGLQGDAPQAGDSGEPLPAPQMEALPRSPERAPLPRQGETSDPSVTTVAQLLEAATVLIVAVHPPEGLSEGSGFFISDRHVVTNHHVVAGVDARHVFVASQALGGVRRATIIARSNPPPTENEINADFAVLELDSGRAPARLRLGAAPAKLATVYVAGFPGFVIRRDNNFESVLKKMALAVAQGDAPAAAQAQESAAAPGADLKYGRINNAMNSGAHALPILIHDMQLAPGNSGGPLVDACGRLGGVNTLLFPSDDGSQQANVAQDVSLLRAFLTASGVAFESDESVCQPPPAAAAAAAGGAAGPERK